MIKLKDYEQEYLRGVTSVLETIRRIILESWTAYDSNVMRQKISGVPDRLRKALCKVPPGFDDRPTRRQLVVVSHIGRSVKNGWITMNDLTALVTTVGEVVNHLPPKIERVIEKREYVIPKRDYKPMDFQNDVSNSSSFEPIVEMDFGTNHIDLMEVIDYDSTSGATVTYDYSELQDSSGT